MFNKHSLKNMQLDKNVEMEIDNLSCVLTMSVFGLDQVAFQYGYNPGRKIDKQIKLYLKSSHVVATFQSVKKFNYDIYMLVNDEESIISFIRQLRCEILMLIGNEFENIIWINAGILLPPSDCFGDQFRIPNTKLKTFINVLRNRYSQLYNKLVRSQFSQDNDNSISVLISDQIVSI